jgi:uncharacterized membrane protein YdjX (TVP38/TMEM64 family)
MNGTNGKSEPVATKRAVPWKWIGLAIVIIALFTAVRVLPATDWLTRFNYWVAHLGIWGVLLFILVYILATVLFFPASILTIGAGFIFGVLLGTAIVSIAATVGAALAFLIARYLARNQIERRVANNPRFKRIDRAIGERGAKLVFLLRLSPLIPFNVSNYFFGLTARQKMDHSVVPWCTYTDPEIARVGLNEAEAKQQDISYDLIRVGINELDRAVIEREELGFIKVLAAKGSDKILGVTIVAAHAGDLLHEFVLAMKYRVGLGQLARTIHAYPTFAELARKVGDHYNKKRLTPFLKKVFNWLYQRSRAASKARSARVSNGQQIESAESQ